MESLLQWWWKDTLHVHTAAATADGVHAAMVVERHPARPHTAAATAEAEQSQHFLYVLTVGGGNTPWMSILLVVEGHPAREYCYW